MTTRDDNEFGLPKLPAGTYFDSVEAVTEQASPGQAHHMRRAFEDIGIDGILCVDRVPTVYFKRISGTLARKEANDLQKKVWNQATASVLVVRDDRTVFIFAAQGKPDGNKSAGEIQHHPSFVEQMNWTAAVLEQERFVERVASGAYYRESEHANVFRPGTSVDHFLIENLTILCEQLAEGKPKGCRSAINAFVGRLVFLCYLVDRGIVHLSDYPEVPAHVDSLPKLFQPGVAPAGELHTLLFNLFDAVREDFNGSMFDDSIGVERELITVGDTDVLCRFLNGEDLPRRQPTLPFYTYEFSVIPVETISAIYERLLGWENDVGRRSAGAFYTPRHLAEMTVEEVCGDFTTLLDKRFLDPSCGSGIFLVTAFNRMADEWRARNPDLAADNDVKFAELTRLLKENLCGIDLNPTACRIACFSLYVALLDQLEPRYLRGYQNLRSKYLPKLLGKPGVEAESPQPTTILEGDFFDIPTDKDARRFDVVLGNPPWVGRLKNDPGATDRIRDWAADKARNPWLKRCGIAEQTRKSERSRLVNAVFLPSNQMAHAFMWKAALHLRPKGRCCLLLPSSVLLNNGTAEFQKNWLRAVALERVIQLADYRRLLFEGAIRPCTMIRCRAEEPNVAEHTFEHVAPRFVRRETRRGLIPVRPDDRERVHLEDALVAVQKGTCTAFWKQLQRSTARERRFLRFLADCPSLADHVGPPDSGTRWTDGVGFQPDYPKKHYPNPKPIPWPLDETLFVSAKRLPQSPVLLQSDCTTLRKALQGMHTSIDGERNPASLSVLRRLPDEKRRLFVPPLLLFNEGFTKFAFVDFPVVFRHTLRSISAPDEDAGLLAFLAACLGSPLAQFLQFHNSSTLATERQRVNLDEEFLAFPFPLPGREHAPSNAREIADEAATKLKRLKSEVEERITREQANDLSLNADTAEEYRSRRIAELRPELNRLVHQYFDLTDEEIALVEDTWEVYMPSATPGRYDKDIPTLRKTAPEQRLTYAEWLCRTLNRWAREAQPEGEEPPFRFVAETAQLGRIGQVMVTVRKADAECKPVEVSCEDAELEETVGRVAALSSEEHGPFEYLYGIIAADGDAIRILKPDQLGEWTRTAALNDAAEIFEAIVQAKRDA